MDRIDNYLQTLYLAEEFSLLDESIGDAIKKFTVEKAKSFTTKFHGAIKSGNMEGAVKIAKSTGLGKVNPEALDKFMNNKSADYAVAKELAYRVLKNSLPGNPKKESINIAATYIATRSLMVEKKGVPPNVSANSKKHIKDFVKKVNKYYDDYEQQIDEAEKEGKAPPIPRDSLPDYIIGAVIIIGFVIVAGSATWWVYNHTWLIFIFLFSTIIAITIIGTKFLTMKKIFSTIGTT